MIMKKLSKLIIASLVLSGSTLIHAAGGQGQGSGQVKFHGYIIAAPCSIVSDDPILVDFGQISNRVLADSGKSHIKPFEIELADCDLTGLNPGNVAVTFSYTGATVTPGGAQSTNLIGFDSGSASGAGVAIVSGGVQAINQKPLPVQLLQTGPNTLEFSSYVQGLGGDLTTIEIGEFYANANFQLNYN